MRDSKVPESIFDFFIRGVKHLFEEEVVAIILFGSAATDEFNPKRSDINFLVVLTQEGIRQLIKVQKVIRRWQKKRISPPLFVTQEYIHESLDSFPNEFLNMRSAYRVLMGKDILKTLEIKKEDVRLQCERELKGKLLQLRQGYILTEGKLRGLKVLISQSIVAFTSIFRGLLFLRDKAIPEGKSQVIIETCREFTEIDEKLFSRLLSVREGKIKRSLGELDEDIRFYIDQIKNLSESVNKMTFNGL